MDTPISIDAIINALKSAGAVIINLYRSMTFEINGHIYDGFLILIGLLLFFYLIEHIWGGDEDE